MILLYIPFPSQSKMIRVWGVQGFDLRPVLHYQRSHYQDIRDRNVYKCQPCLECSPQFDTDQFMLSASPLIELSLPGQTCSASQACLNPGEPPRPHQVAHNQQLTRLPMKIF
jgi:hypothetical protein